MSSESESTVADILEVFLHASTRPCLAVTRAGAKWVMKLAGAGAGPRGLLTEFLAGRIARAMGAPVPDMRPLELPAGFPWKVGTDEFDEMLQRSFGWNLGVAYVEGARLLGAGEVMAQDSGALARIAAADRWLQNVDRTARNPNLLWATGGLWAIDYDACLFLDRAITRRAPFSFDLPSGHLLAGVMLPAAPLHVPAAVVADAVREAPADWIESSGLASDDLIERLCEYARAAPGSAAA